jgi:hypothetical protein
VIRDPSGRSGVGPVRSRGTLCPEQGRVSINYINKRLCIPIFATSVLVGAGPAHADAVTDWNAIMQATVSVPPTNPNFQARWSAIVQLADFEAVNAVVGDYEPYLGPSSHRIGPCRALRPSPPLIAPR